VRAFKQFSSTCCDQNYLETQTFQIFNARKATPGIKERRETKTSG